MPTDDPDDREDRTPADQADERERRAVDAATSERLDQGVRRDSHGELVPEPFPDGDDPDDSSDEVIERHRRQADELGDPNGDRDGDT